MTDTTIHKSIFLSADPATVWSYLTKADLLGKWFHPATEDLRDGADFTLVSAKDGERMCYGRVTSATPHSALDKGWHGYLLTLHDQG